MKSNQYARIGKVLPLNLYRESSGMKALSYDGKEQEAKQFESSMKY